MRKLITNLSLLIGTSVFLLAMLEVFSRYAIPPVSRVNTMIVSTTIRMRSPVPGIPYLLRYGGTATQEFKTDPRGYFDDGATLTYVTNSNGFRGPYASRKKTAGTFRIIGLGDSFTFGTGVRNGDTFISRLQVKLNEMSADTPVEVLNFGAPGYDTVMEVNLLKLRGLIYHPDMVVICFFLNDAGGGLSTWRRLSKLAPIDEQPYWRRKSRFLDYVATLVDRKQAAKALAESYRKSVGDYAPGWIEAKRALMGAKKLSKEDGFDLLLMIFPSLWNLSDNYPFRDVHEKVASFAEGQSIPVLDLLPDFAGFDGPELWVHPNNSHPNEIAHEVVANSLARFIMKYKNNILSTTNNR